jgi:hypothetical protein
MGVSVSTLVTWHHDRGFLMYRRGRAGHKPAWFTNDTLIQSWEISRCRVDHADKLARRTKRTTRAKT